MCVFLSRGVTPVCPVWVWTSERADPLGPGEFPSLGLSVFQIKAVNIILVSVGLFEV